MTDDEALIIPGGALRTAWVFSADVDEARITAIDAAAQAGAADPSDGFFGELLGVPGVDPAGVELFHAEKIAAYGLARYLTEAAGMDEAAIASDEAKLNGLTGPLLILHGSALPEGVDRIGPSDELHLIGRYVETPLMELRPAPSSASAQGVIETPTDVPSARSGSLGKLVVALLITVMIAGVIWLAA